MKKIAEGAEASIFSAGSIIVKKRRRKSYRVEELDEKLRKSRTKREAKVIGRLENAGIAVPKIIAASGTTLKMERIPGKKLRDILNGRNIRLCREVGKDIQKMHDAGIIHGDLTTSNMIYSKKVFLIDFGLSFFSGKAEDKAVDVHLFRQALNSYHSKIAERCWKQFLEGYTDKEVLQRLEIVETRGKYKRKSA